jgi:protein phosphatase
MIPKIKWATKTHKGLMREENEDSFLCEPELGLFIVADGMGGHEAGEVAANIACTSIKEFIINTKDKPLKKFPIAYKKNFSLEWNRLLGAFSYANGKIINYAEKQRYLAGMGTTIVATLFYDKKLTYAHVGDSRLYQFKNGMLKLLTEDHSWVQEQVKLGNLTPEEAQVHPLKNVVTRALGGSSKLSIDIADISLENGDKFLLCSDGLNVVVPEEVILKILKEEKDLDKATEKLLQETLKRGAPDNITVILLETVFEK